MSPDQVLALAMAFFKATLMIATPFVAASLVAGVGVGVLQTATQVNEASVSYVVKVTAVIAVFVALGPTLGAEAIRYTKQSFESVATVVR